MELRLFAQQVLFGEQLVDKLPGASLFTDEAPGPALLTLPEFPGRPEALRPSRGARAPFPSRPSLEDPQARGLALHFFANHELLAMELMALILLRFPDAPMGFRLGLAQTLREEQQHLAAYQEHMQRLGVPFGAAPVNRFFWDCLADSPDPATFLAGMSLTFEQANLDYCRRYGAWMAEAGDLEAAALLERVRREEVGHVRHGLTWIRRWSPGEDDWSAYTRRLRPPMTPERAKGGDFCLVSRQEAGLEPGFVRALQAFGHSKGRPPVLRLFNPGHEGEWGKEPAPLSGLERELMQDLGLLPAFLGGRDDAVALLRRPSQRFLAGLAQAGVPLPELIEVQDPSALGEVLAGRKLGGLEPWGWSPRSAAWLQPLREQVVGGPSPEPSPAWASLSDKREAAKDLEFLLGQAQDPRLDPLEDVGQALAELDTLPRQLAQAQARGHRGLILKAPFSASGRDALRLEGAPTQAQRRWLERCLARGPLLAEPWLDRVLDLSMQLWVDPDRVRPLGVHRFTTDPRGRYLGSWLGEWTAGLSPELGRFVTGEGRDRAWVERSLSRAAQRVGERARALGFVGPMGLDAMLHRSKSGLRLRPLVELNARSTMGRLALALRRRLSPGVAGVWRILTRAEVQRHGLPDLGAWAQGLPPPELDPRGGLRAGLLLTTEVWPDSGFASAVSAAPTESAAWQGFGLGAPPAGV